MIWATLVASLLHPVGFIVMGVGLALAGCAAVPGILSVVACTAMFGIPVLTAACVTKVFYSWCFGGLVRGHRAVPLLAGVLAGTQLLRHGMFLPALAGMWLQESLSMSAMLLVLTNATAFAVVVSVSVMFSVLLLEVPMRWMTSAFGARELHQVLVGLRWMGVTFAVSVVWILIVDFAGRMLMSGLERLAG